MKKGYFLIEAVMGLSVFMVVSAVCFSVYMYSADKQAEIKEKGETFKICSSICERYLGEKERIFPGKSVIFIDNSNDLTGSVASEFIGGVSLIGSAETAESYNTQHKKYVVIITVSNTEKLSMLSAECFLSGRYDISTKLSCAV